MTDHAMNAFKISMQPRFSLRTMFLATTLVAGLCLWFLLPTFTGKKFLKAIDAEDFAAADHLFANPKDCFLADWAENRWGLRAKAQLEPLTFGQLIRNRRDLFVSIRYFKFDQNFEVVRNFTATPFGLKITGLQPPRRLGYFYEDEQQRSLRHKPEAETIRVPPTPPPKK